MVGETVNDDSNSRSVWYWNCQPSDRPCLRQNRQQLVVRQKEEARKQQTLGRQIVVETLHDLRAGERGCKTKQMVEKRTQKYCSCSTRKKFRVKVFVRWIIACYWKYFAISTTHPMHMPDRAARWTRRGSSADSQPRSADQTGWACASPCPSDDARTARQQWGVENRKVRWWFQNNYLNLRRNVIDTRPEIVCSSKMWMLNVK